MIILRAFITFLLVLHLATLNAPPARAAVTENGQTSSPRRQITVPAPAGVLHFTPGDDRKLASWAQVCEYFRALAQTSRRVRFEELGRTTKNAPFVLATISAPENLARLAQYQDIQRQLADSRTIKSTAQARDLIARGKTIVLITCGVHSTEVGSYLSGMLIAHRLASSDEPEIQNILHNCIVLLVPSLNPDGVDIVKNWYDRTLGTPYEGSTPPELYHQYTGHDNNRDWYAFTQKETQLTVDRVHNVWHPQIVHDIHQQGSFGARLFLPPYMQPVEPNVPSQIVAGYTELGNFIAAEMRAANYTGITTNSTYDAWTPGRAYSHYHGGVRILSETASARLATPRQINFAELRGEEGYDARRTSQAFPVLWKGGNWALRDITDYMTTAAFTLLRHAADHRAEWLTRFYEIGKEAVRPRRGGELWAYTIPPATDFAGTMRRQALLSILQRGGVEIHYADLSTQKRASHPAELTAIVRLAQPYGAFAKALLEKQTYPHLLNTAGEPIEPYDVTAHTLPLLMGVKVQEVYRPFTYQRTNLPGGYGGGSHRVDPRLAIYRSSVPSMDEGWTRWAIESEPQIARYSSIGDKEVRAGNLHARYQVIILPDQAPNDLLNGHAPGTMPPEYVGGLGREGVDNLREFVEGGGTLICLNRASNFAINQLGLPVTDVTANLKRTEFYAPGSILRTFLDTTHPIAAGTESDSIAWVENSPVFAVTDSAEASRRVRIVARYPGGEDALLSGYLLGGEKIRNRAALVDVALGRGHIYLFGFRPQYRGQSLATYPLLFNAILHTQQFNNTASRAITNNIRSGNDLVTFRGRQSKFFDLSGHG